MIQLQSSMKTFFKFVLHKAMLDDEGNPMFHEDGCPMVMPGTARDGCAWSPNTFLDAGREEIARRTNWSSYCQVGTNSQAPVPSDTSLYGWVAGTNVLFAEGSSSGAQPSEPYYGWRRRTWRFPQGSTAAILNEVALGWGTGSGGTSQIAIRALTVDPNGTPVPVVPQPDEILDVMGEIRYYPMLGDVADQVVIDGETYDTITRASMVNNEPQYRDIGVQMGKSTAIDSFNFASYSGELGEVTQNPTAIINGNDTLVSDLTYNANTYFRDMQIEVGPLGWNDALGVRCITFTGRGGRVQVRLGNVVGDTTLPKTALKTLSFTFRNSWDGFLFDGTWQRGPDDDAPTTISQQWETNVAQTILRISWDDAVSDDRREDLKVPDGTMFHMQYDLDSEIWVQFTMDEFTTWTEGTDWTEYTVTITATGDGGAPSSGNVCSVRAVTP